MSNTEQIQIIENNFLDQLDNLMDTFHVKDVVVHLRHFAGFESAFEPLKEGSIITKGRRDYTLTESEIVDLSFDIHGNKFTFSDANIFVEKLHALSVEIQNKERELYTTLHTL